MSNDGPIEIGWRKELISAAAGSGEPAPADPEANNSVCSNKDGLNKTKYRKLSSASSDSSSSSSSSCSSMNSPITADDKKRKKKEERAQRKEAKRLKKEHKKLEKVQKKELKKAKKEKRKEEKKLRKLAKKDKRRKSNPGDKSSSEEGADYGIPIDLMYTKANAPETREEYEKRQSQIRRVEDPITGRTRLIKGDGEVLEEIVSRNRHQEINKQATKGDGYFFQSNTVGQKPGRY